MAIVTGKKLRYVAMITTLGHVVADEEDDHRREGHDRDRLAGNHIRPEGALQQSVVDEGDGQANSEHSAEHETDESFAPGVERLQQRGSRRASRRVPEFRGATMAPQMSQM